MGIDIDQLSPAAQKQALAKLMELERRKAAAAMPKVEPKEEPQRKLHEQKVQGTLIDGTPVTFDSKREQARYGELVLMQKAGEISDLQYQVRFDLIPSQVRDDGKKERGIYYIADFVYRDKDRKLAVEDSKGYRNPSSAAYAKFVIKRKLMLWVHGITVKEV